MGVGGNGDRERLGGSGGVDGGGPDRVARWRSAGLLAYQPDHVVVGLVAARALEQRDRRRDRAQRPGQADTEAIVGRGDPSGQVRRPQLAQRAVADRVRPPAAGPVDRGEHHRDPLRARRLPGCVPGGEELGLQRRTGNQVRGQPVAAHRLELRLREPPAKRSEFVGARRVQRDVPGVLQHIGGDRGQPTDGARDQLTAFAAVGGRDDPAGATGSPLAQRSQRHPLVEEQLEIIQPQHGILGPDRHRLPRVEQRSQGFAVHRGDQLQLPGQGAPAQRLEQRPGLAHLRATDHHHQPVTPARQRRRDRVAQHGVDLARKVVGQRGPGQHRRRGLVHTDQRRVDLGDGGHPQPTIRLRPLAPPLQPSPRRDDHQTSQRGHGGHDQTGNRQPRDAERNRQCCQRGRRGQTPRQHGLAPAPRTQRRRPAHPSTVQAGQPCGHESR